MIALHLLRALGLRGSLVLACLLILAVTAYGIADDLESRTGIRIRRLAWLVRVDGR
jgi:hypothetical protein